MNNPFERIEPKQLNFNTFGILDDEWMLVTGGIKSNCNTMTASWGGFGILWNKPVAFVFIRPQRYTYQFAEKYDHLTLSFFTEQYRDALNYCGSHSGKDVDKIKECGLTLFETEAGSIGFNEARMVLECKKLYFQDIDPVNFLDQKIDKMYPKKDYHRMFICEITNCFHKK